MFSNESAYTVSVSATDRASNSAQAGASFVIDKTAPSTTSSLMGTLGSGGWYSSNVTAYLNAADPVSGGVSSGVSQTYYKVGSGSWMAYTASGIPVITEGSTTISYYSVDAAGNSEAVRTTTVNIDKSAPTVTINSPQQGSVYVNILIINQLIHIDFNATDAGSGIQSTTALLNGRVVQNGDCIPANRLGTNTFSVTAVDKAGQTTTKTVTFYVKLLGLL